MIGLGVHLSGQLDHILNIPQNKHSSKACGVMCIYVASINVVSVQYSPLVTFVQTVFIIV